MEKITRLAAPRQKGTLVRYLGRTPTGLAGGLLLVIFVAAATAAPAIAPYSPASINIKNRLASPTWEHLLGTDQLGRDTLSRILFGARYSLGTAAAVTITVTTIGVLVGIVAGFTGKWVDEILMRLIDTLLAFPSIVLSLVVVGLLGPGLRNLVIAMIMVRWTIYARVVRGMVLSLREREFITAAQCIGVKRWRIMTRHLLPNVLGPLIVLTTMDFGRVILGISGLSFIGLGIQLPRPEWGAMLSDGRSYVQAAPLLTILPGLAIALTVLSANLLGDALRDYLDPRSERY